MRLSSIASTMMFRHSLVLTRQQLSISRRDSRMSKFESCINHKSTINCQRCTDWIINHERCTDVNFLNEIKSKCPTAKIKQHISKIISRQTIKVFHTAPWPHYANKNVTARTNCTTSSHLWDACIFSPKLTHWWHCHIEMSGWWLITTVRK